MFFWITNLTSVKETNDKKKLAGCTYTILFWFLGVATQQFLRNLKASAEALRQRISWFSSNSPVCAHMLFLQAVIISFICKIFVSDTIHLWHANHEKVRNMIYVIILNSDLRIYRFDLKVLSSPSRKYQCIKNFDVIRKSQSTTNCATDGLLIIPVFFSHRPCLKSFQRSFNLSPRIFWVI